MSNIPKVKKRIEGREIATTLLALAKSDLKDKDPEVVIGFYNALRAAANEHTPAADQFEEMTDAEARRFEEDVMEFGMYATKKMTAVPFSYIAMFVRTGIRYLRYARSERARRRSDWEHTF